MYIQYICLYVFMMAFYARYAYAPLTPPVFWPCKQTALCRKMKEIMEWVDWLNGNGCRWRSILCSYEREWRSISEQYPYKRTTMNWRALVGGWWGGNVKLILILCNVVPQMNRIEWESERNETKRKTQTMRVDFTSLKHDTEMNFFFKRRLLQPSGCGCGYGCGYECGYGCGCGCANAYADFYDILLADSVGLVFEFAFAVRMAREMDRIGLDQNESDRISAVIGTIDASARLLVDDHTAIASFSSLNFWIFSFACSFRMQSVWTNAVENANGMISFSLLFKRATLFSNAWNVGLLIYHRIELLTGIHDTIHEYDDFAGLQSWNLISTVCKSLLLSPVFAVCLLIM